MQMELQPVRFGLVLALLSIFLGFGMGGFFGIGEDSLKSKLKASAEAVRETAYQGDDGRLQKTLDKSWIYLQRSHLHWGAIGTASLVQILLLAFLSVRPWVKMAASLMLGGGALGYGAFWLLAGFRAPGMGGTGPAKESLVWLGQPAAGLCLLGTAIVLALVLKGIGTSSGPASSSTR